MATEASEPTTVDQTFDLRAQSDAKRQDYESMRVALLVVGTLFALVLGLILSVSLRASGLSTPTEWVQFLVLVPGLGCMFGVLVYAAYKLGPGVASLTVGADGLAFRSASGRLERLPWGRVTRGFILLDYTITPAIPKLTGVSRELRRRNRPSSYLSAEAFEAIVRGAERRGLRASSVVPSQTDFRHNFWGWARCRIVQFSAVS